MHQVSRTFAILFFVVGLIDASKAAVPTVRWANAIGTTGERTRRLSIDANENVYVTGYFTTNGFIGTNSLQPQGPTEFFIAKYNKNGTNLWVHTAGGPGVEEGLGSSIDDQGDVYVISDMRSNVSFDSTNLVLQGFNNLFLAKYTSEGTFQWARQIVNVAMSASDIFARGTNVYVITAAAGNLDFGAGAVTNTVLALARYDSTGNLLAVHRIADGTSISFTGNGASGLQVGADGNGYATFLFSSPLTVGGSLVSISGQGNNGLVVKWDDSGTVLWFRQLTGDSSSLRSLRLNPDGDVTIVGQAPRTGSFTGQLVTNAFLARLSSSGATRWIKNISANASLNDIETDSTGNLFVCGRIPGADGQLGSVLVTNTPGKHLALTAKLDGNGDVLWIKTGQPASASYPEGSSLRVTPRGAIYVTGFLGFASDSFYFDSATVISGSGYDSFLERIDPEPPTLSIRQTGANVLLSWPATAQDWILERTTQWDDTWQTITNLVFQGGQFVVMTNATTIGAEYFRLKATD